MPLQPLCALATLRSLRLKFYRILFNRDPQDLPFTNFRKFLWQRKQRTPRRKGRQKLASAEGVLKRRENEEGHPRDR
ncbi:MAG: hypothetical protein CK425_03140 [Parachlamydia sp.]|nr:MAG: hypothetical protein CK425_03140 [Parachlamydia sp.]